MRSKFSLTLGQLNRALNNPVLVNKLNTRNLECDWRIQLAITELTLQIRRLPWEKDYRPKSIVLACTPLPFSSSIIGDTAIFLPWNLSGNGSSLRWPSSILVPARLTKLTFRLSLNIASVPPVNFSNDMLSFWSRLILSHLQGPGWSPLWEENVRQKLKVRKIDYLTLIKRLFW